eukprot:TRINITY_DN15345_c0_g1_i1.p1 TRINITY_DN15345_c0_g1~~TRINITY_DN15345_c0_g1_i1.p1  ORF type:complete len:136 (-),score=3.18 TRINITY_DN15345_c0_g1_i1:366-773(-)
MLMKCRSKNRPNHSIAYGTLLLAMPASFSSASWPSNLALNMAEINVGHARSNLWAALPLTARHRSLAEVDPPTAFIYLHSATVQILWPRTISEILLLGQVAFKMQVLAYRYNTVWAVASGIAVVSAFSLHNKLWS